MCDPLWYLYAGSSLRMHTLPCAPIRRKKSLFSPYSLKQARNAPPVRACAVVARRRTHTPTHSSLRGSQVTSIINKANRPPVRGGKAKNGKENPVIGVLHGRTSRQDVRLHRKLHSRQVPLVRQDFEGCARGCIAQSDMRKEFKFVRYCKRLDGALQEE